MQNVIKVYHVVQELLTFPLTGSRWTDGRTDSHSNYGADPRVVQFYIVFLCVFTVYFTITHYNVQELSPEIKCLFFFLMTLVLSFCKLNQHKDL